MDSRLRNYTRRNISKGFFDNFFRKLSLTNWIILVNVIVFISVYIFSSIFGIEKVVSYIALQPDKFFSGQFWTVLTSMFVHIEIWHLFANMLSLFFIGNLVERLIGRKRLLWVYLFSGIFAGLFFACLSYFLGNLCLVKLFGNCIGGKIFGSPSIGAVGASGAIFALVGILAFLTPYKKVYLIAGPLVAIILQAILSGMSLNSGLMVIINLLLNIYIIVAIFAMFSFNPNLVKFSLPVKMSFMILPIVAIVPLILIGLFIDLPIGNMAHLGGLIAGLGYGYYLRVRYRKKTEMIRKYFAD